MTVVAVVHEGVVDDHRLRVVRVDGERLKGANLARDRTQQLARVDELPVREAKEADRADAEDARRLALLALAGGDEALGREGGIIGPLRAVRDDEVADLPAGSGEQRGRPARAEVGVIGVGGDDHGAAQFALVRVRFARRLAAEEVFQARAHRCLQFGLRRLLSRPSS